MNRENNLETKPHKKIKHKPNSRPRQRIRDEEKDAAKLNQTTKPFRFGSSFP